MSNASRIPGKRGKRPARHEPTLALSRFERVMKVASPPPSGDVSGGIVDWGMLGNDQYGDCGVAAKCHLEMLQSVVDGASGTYDPGYGVHTDASAIAEYFAYGAAQGEGTNADEGVELSTYLGWLYSRGKIDAYAELDVSSPGAADRVHQAMIDFGGVLVGVNLTDDAEQLFSAGQPWTTANGESPDAQEGHAIALVKYDANGDTFVTWGAEQGSTINWDSVCIDEAWVLITPDEAELAGYDFAAVSAELYALHGTGSAPQDAPKPVEPPVAPVLPPSAPAGSTGHEGLAEDILTTAHRLVRRAEEIAEEAYRWASENKNVEALTNIATVISTIAGLAHYFGTYPPSEPDPEPQEETA